MLDGVIFRSRVESDEAGNSTEDMREGCKSWLCEKVTQLRANRRLVIGDMVAATAAVWMSVTLAHGQAFSGNLTTMYSVLIPLAFCISFFVFNVADFYRSHTRSTSLRDILVVSRGVLLAVVLQAAVATFAAPLTGLVAADFVIQFFLTTSFLCGLRIIARRREMMRRYVRMQAQAEEAIPVVMIGTGTNCDLFLRSLRNRSSKYTAIGVIDDIPDTMGLYFQNVKVLGSVVDAEATIDAIEALATKPKQILLTEDASSFDDEGLSCLVEWAKSNGVKVARLPGLGEPVAHRESVPGENIRIVDPEEILNRPQKQVERSLLRELFEGRRVLITGAGGSIGSELTRQVASFNPSMVVLIEQSEFNAYTIDMDLAQRYPEVQRYVHVANIRDEARVNGIFQKYKPELVFNAAALKHVPMVELNPCEGVLTNVIGTRNVADAARSVGAIAMVQVSTDKAVNTTNVMGATKRVAEFYAQAQDRIMAETGAGTRFFSVRFGNVLGSSGSLIPLFQKQISEGGPLTVTDPRMERFFMTIREAVELTLVAAAKGLAQKSGLGEIFVLDMGEPVKIVDMAERMIRLAGLEPYKDVDIEFIGIRPGEKLFEELFDKAEERRDSGFEGVQSALPDGVPMAQLRAAILHLEQAAKLGDEATVRRHLQKLVPGYGRAEIREVVSDKLARKTVSVLPPKRARAAEDGTRRQAPQSGSEQQLWAGE